jgi:hypothetical protein
MIDASQRYLAPKLIPTKQTENCEQTKNCKQIENGKQTRRLTANCIAPRLLEASASTPPYQYHSMKS